MRVSVSALARELRSLRAPGCRVGLPDDEISLTLDDPSSFTLALDAAATALQLALPDSVTVVDVHPDTSRGTVRFRFKQCSATADATYGAGSRSRVLIEALAALSGSLERESGLLDYSVGASFFDVHLPDPSRSPHRTEFPDIEGLSWEQSYRYLLSRATWSSLRDRAFERSDLASRLGDYCHAKGLRVVLIPSVGLAVHPWIFADRGLRVLATDFAQSALSALRRPEERVKMYSQAAWERWDIDMTASFSTFSHPERLSGMPRLEDPEVTTRLGSSIAFLQADWSALPLRSHSVDLVFAINALPRESEASLEAVVAEWVRVTRRGGVLFIAQHNPGKLSNVDQELNAQGWERVDILRGDAPRADVPGGFQWISSSG